MKRIDIINALVQKHNYKNYLEIGVESGGTFGAVKAPYKIGLDPDDNAFATHHITSDEYFKDHIEDEFDIFLIDGLHEAQQVRKDIANCLGSSRKGFTIVCHDMLPESETSNSGDCWKAFVELRRTVEGLEMFTINTDHGIGIIRAGEQELLDTDLDMTYENFAANRDEWMNMISIDDFNAKLRE
jgi:Methyltransferase domain